MLEALKLRTLVIGNAMDAPFARLERAFCY